MLPLNKTRSFSSLAILIRVNRLLWSPLCDNTFLRNYPFTATQQLLWRGNVLVFTLSRAEEENLITPSKVVVDLWPSMFLSII